MKVAAIIYHEQTHHVLCGFESYYCYEESDNMIETNRIRELEICSEMEASQRAINLSKLYQREIRYGSFYKNRTHYCCLTTNSHLGIIKGNSYTDEDPMTAIRREIEEEVGIIVNPERLQKINFIKLQIETTVFLLPVTHNESVNIILHINKLRKQHCGELFDIKFRDVDKIEYCNFITKQVKKWIKRTRLPTNTSTSLLHFTKLLDTHTTIDQENYLYSRIKEPPFVWRQKRYSLLNIWALKTLIF